MSEFFHKAGRLHGKFAAALNTVQHALLLAIRLFWGWQFFEAGKGKLGDLSSTAGFFGDLGIPFPGFNAALAATTECVGGLFLMAGLFSRLTAIPLVVTMVVAYCTAHQEELGAIFSAPDEFTSAAPFLFLFASLLVLVFGPGKLSLDHLLGRKFGQTALSSPT